MKQSTSRLLMVRPLSFRHNEETNDNTFQNDSSAAPEDIRVAAIAEFDAFVDRLRAKGISVVVRDSDILADTPDALFPNNWISFHDDERVAIYPMKAENRRRERREDLIFEVCNELGLSVDEVVDFTEFEEHESYLEGTGSMVLDRTNRVCYAALSERTDEHAVELFCDSFGYRALCFHTVLDQKPVYHTNVVMCIGTGFVTVCLDVISNPDERTNVRDSLVASGKIIIEISTEQLRAFAGNMLEVLNEEGSTYIVLSEQAHTSLTPTQISALSQFGELLPVALPTIELHGGGSARCMLCEVFLPLI
jgi:hypothetical protein